MVLFPIHDLNRIKHIRIAYVTYGLIGVNCLIFLVQFLLPAAVFDQAILQLGMVPLVVRNQAALASPLLPGWASLLTYGFLHADWLHLFGNMFFLWVFGDNVEDAFGHWRFLAFYLACTIAAAGAHVLANPDASGPLIGASGAVAGVMGAYVLLYPHAKVIVLAKIIVPIPLPIPALWMLGFWVVTQFLFAFMGTSVPIAWWAHIGGILVGVALTPLLKRRDVPLFGGRDG